METLERLQIKASVNRHAGVGYQPFGYFELQGSQSIAGSKFTSSVPAKNAVSD
jgi:hypothetical protein